MPFLVKDSLKHLTISPLRTSTATVQEVIDCCEANKGCSIGFVQAVASTVSVNLICRAGSIIDQISGRFNTVSQVVVRHQKS